MTDLSECDQFKDHRREICRGEAGLLLEGDNGVNAYRAAWGMPAIGCLGTQTQKEQAQDPPPLMVRGWNFAAAITRWTLAGMPRRTQAEIDERLAICQACPFLHNNHCTKCGCACVEQNRLVNKLALTTEKCPEGKWD